MKREHLIWLLAVLSLGAAGWWLSLNTEWVEVTEARGAQGEARDNPVYAFEQLLRRLGMQVQHHETLATMPPPQARLLLLSGDWSLMPERAGQLQDWVQHGGHLVLTQDSGWQTSALARWVPVTVLDEMASLMAARRQPKVPPPKPSSAASAGTSTSHTRSELVSTPPLWGSTERIVTCNFGDTGRTLSANSSSPAWTLTRYGATYALRLPVGQGSVTVLSAGQGVFRNAPALTCDMPLMLAAALQAEPGATAWVYLHEKRLALLPWLWQQGWIAIAAGLLALAAGLWRAAVRFGPRQAAPPRLRRSISEQVRGLGSYLQRGSPDALLAAQQRALHEAADRALPRYLRLAPAERATAVAAATGVAADELASAMATRFCTRAGLPPLLQLLETARRRLLRSPDERHPP